MIEISETELNKFVAACHAVEAHALMRCSSGNLSSRIDEEHMLVSESRSWLGSLSKDQVSISRISDGESLNNKTPTVEIGFHAGILQTRPDINVVLHYQSPNATALVCHQGPREN